MHKPLIALMLGLSVSHLAAAGELDDLLAAALQDRTIPAMAVLTIEGGRAGVEAVAGVRALGGSEPARAGDPWHIGSDGKAMTATLIARLVERGVLSWSAPLKDLLPLASMQAAYRDVTLADLLAHRAGLPRNYDEQWIEGTRRDARPLAALRLAYAELALAEPAAGPVRSDASYSNSGYIIAAVVAERATGKSYEVLMQEEVFGPLGMRVETGVSKRGQPLGHDKGKPLEGDAADIPPFFAPAGATMKMPLREWAKFAVDQMAGEQGRGKLLKESSYQYLHAPQDGAYMALGWGVRTGWPANAPMRILTHSGSNGYWHAVIALAPDKMSGVLVTSNAGEGSGAEQQQMRLMMTLMGAMAVKP